MKWKRTKPLHSEDLIEDFEKEIEFSFPRSFRKIILKNNGGRPARFRFSTNKAVGRCIERFLSFYKEDLRSIWNILMTKNKDFERKYIPFAIDNFGNLICFDKHSRKIVFIFLETMEEEYVADNFDDFLKKLY